MRKRETRRAWSGSFGFTPVSGWLCLCLPFGAARRPRSLAGRAPSPPRGAGVLARDGQKWQQAKPRLHGRKGAALPQSTAVSELERTKGTRLLNRNIA